MAQTKFWCIDQYIITTLIFQGESSSVALPPGTLVKVLFNFTALREDEITVTRGEVIQGMKRGRQRERSMCVMA